MAYATTSAPTGPVSLGHQAGADILTMEFWGTGPAIRGVQLSGTTEPLVYREPLIFGKSHEFSLHSLPFGNVT